MFAVCVITLCLVAVSHQAPLTCDNLVRSLDEMDRHDLEGRWALVAGSLRDPADLENFKLRDSVSINFVNGSEASAMSFTGMFRFGANCHYLASNITLEGPSFYLAQYNLTASAVQTSCPDCAVMRFSDESQELKRLYLFSRRREVEQKEMEEFRAQVKCFNMPDPVLMDPTKELCPEQLPTKPDAQS